MFRRGKDIALYLGPDRFDLQFETKKLAQDMQTPSKWSMLRLKRFVRYLLDVADVGCDGFMGEHRVSFSASTCQDRSDFLSCRSEPH